MPENKRHIVAEDLYRMVGVQDPQISPDGRQIAFVQLIRDRHQNKARQSIWLAATDGSRLRQFTNGEAADTAPRWSPDGTSLVFVSTRTGKPQLYLIPADGGEAVQLTYMPNGATAPAWSPDGRQIAFLSSARPEEWQAETDKEDLPPAGLDEQDKAKPDEEAEKKRVDPRVVERLPYRSGTTYWDGRYAQVYVLPVTPDADGRRRPRRLTGEPRDYGTLYWSPDGLALYCIASRKPEHDAPWMFNSVVRIDAASGAQAQLTGEGWTCHEVRPSPDGRWLACLAHPDRLPTNQFSRLALLPAAGGEFHLLEGMPDRNITAVEWAADGESLRFVAQDGGSEPLYRIDISGSQARRVMPLDATVTGFHTGPDDVVAATIFTADGYHELYASVAGSEFRRLTDFNRAFLDSVSVATAEKLHYTSPDGTPVDGWVIRPPDYEAGKRYPLAVNIHGGPQGMWGASTPTMWLEWQHHAASGYVVFFCNPRGSTGYDEAFMLANLGDWGDGPMQDVLAGVDQLVERGLADPERLAITGGSYGGYLTAWIIGHDQRFKAAVAQRGVYHLLAFHGTTDIPLFMASNVGAEPWEDPQAFWRLSPLAYAEQITTPLLILHSENDFRVPISEAEQLFATLKRLGRTVQLVRYPREGHELSRSGEPAHIVDRLQRIVNWWDRYCKPPREEAPV